MKSTPVAVDVAGMPELLAGIDRIEAFAAANGIAIPRSSRLGLYISVLRGLKSGSTTHRGPIDVGGAVFELRQLIAIIDGLKRTPSLASTLRVLLDGGYSTIDAPVHDPARDKQFELFVAARLALGGLRAELAEPDIVVDLGGKQVGIAAKRPRTAAGLKSAIRKAGRQVRNASRWGFLAIDASLYPIPKALVLSVFLDRVGDVSRATAERLQGLVYDNLALLRPRLLEEPERSGTLGLLFHLSMPFMIGCDHGFTAAVGEAWLVVPANFQLTPVLIPLLRSLGPTARILASPSGFEPVPRTVTEAS